ncbi:MAG: ATP-binding protein [Oscillospiraceae bacterium]|nr:ATP-binding protein [Oscillospiraceae bacterium]
MGKDHNEYVKELSRKLDLLSVFSRISQDKVFHAFGQCIYRYAEVPEEQEEFHANFCGALYNLAETDNWTEYLTQKVLSLENPCAVFAAKGKKIPVYLEEAARNDLRILSEFAAVTPEMLADEQDLDLLPRWHAEPVDLETAYFAWISEIHRHGYGDYALYKMFCMEQNKNSESDFILKPVKYPDAVQLQDLIGYEFQKNQVIANTKALLKGLKASNILLYGDAGTGKSATVKAVANAYADEGLRLIELSKNELHLLPKLLEELSENPLKFILFIDDLSFQENDDDFSALKAVLEGSICARLHNTVIYATSNRRHIVRETFSQRAGDEIHRNDTIQETISLSERFGIQILYDKPNKNLYLEIVCNLAKQYHLEITPDQLAIEAERFALRKGGRSARSARQLVEQLCAKQKI